MAIIGVDVLMKKFGNSDYIERISGEESIRYVANIPLRKFGVEAIKAFVTKTMEYQLRPMKALLEDVSKGEDSILYKMMDKNRHAIGTDYFDHVLYYVSELFTTDNCIRVYYMSKDKSSFNKMLRWTAKCNLIYGADMDALVKNVVVPYIQQVLIPSMKFTKEDEKLFNEDNQEYRKEGDTFYSQCLNIDIPLARDESDPFKIMTYFNPKKGANSITFNGVNAYLTSGRGGRDVENKFLFNNGYGTYVIREYIKISPVEGMHRMAIRDFYNMLDNEEFIYGLAKKVSECAKGDVDILKHLDISNEPVFDVADKYLNRLTPKRSAVDLFESAEKEYINISRFHAPANLDKTEGYKVREGNGRSEEVANMYEFVTSTKSPTELRRIGGINALKEELQKNTEASSIRSFIKSCCDEFDYYDEFSYKYDLIYILDKIYGFKWEALRNLEGIVNMIYMELYFTSQRPRSYSPYHCNERETSNMILSRGGWFYFYCNLKRVY